MSIFACTVAMATEPDRQVDLAEVTRACRLFPDPELDFYLQTPDGSYRFIDGGDVGAIVRAVIEVSNDRCVYWRLHPLTKGSREARVANCARRRWLLIDVDTVKRDEDKGLMADDGQREAARAMAVDVLGALHGLGWPAPVQVDSGNGWHLYYRVDLPADEESRRLTKAVLAAVGSLFHGDPRGEIDTGVYPATQNGKMPGTWARNRREGIGRPHRLCRFVNEPQELVCLTADQLRQVAGSEATNGARPVPVNGRGTTGSVFGMAAGRMAGATAYGRAALDAECGKIAMAPDGRRQKQLWDSACAIGELVGQEIEHFEASGQLYVAACRCGLDRDVNCGEHKVRDTIERGITQGKTQPRTADGRNGTPPAPVRTAAPAQAPARPVLYALPDLLRMQFPEPRWAVPGILSEGLTILAGAPKAGKSWMALNLAITIAAGGMALGQIQVQAGDVLYLSLEDRLRRVQVRSRKLLAGLDMMAPGRLQIAVEWPSQVEAGLERIGEWMGEAERPTLVVIDVWAKFRPSSNNKRGQYEQDYEHATAVKSMADRRDCSVLLIHHTRKSESADPLEMVSGTLGLPGAADGILVLTRARNENEAQLMMTGRDIEEKQLALKFDPVTCVWTSEGNADDRMRSKIRQAVLNLFKTTPGGSYFPSEVATITNQNPSSIKCEMWRMAEEGILQKRGAKYVWPVTESGPTSF